MLDILPQCAGIAFLKRVEAVSLHFTWTLSLLASVAVDERSLLALVGGIVLWIIGVFWIKAEEFNSASRR